jgi:hypothetical protein
MGMHRHRQYLQVADPPLRGELENNCPASGPDVLVGLGVEVQSHMFDCSLRLELLRVSAPPKDGEFDLLTGAHFEAQEKRGTQLTNTARCQAPERGN